MCCQVGRSRSKSLFLDASAGFALIATGLRLGARRSCGRARIVPPRDQTLAGVFLASTAITKRRSFWLSSGNGSPSDGEDSRIGYFGIVLVGGAIFAGCVAAGLTLSVRVVTGQRIAYPVAVDAAMYTAIWVGLAVHLLAWPVSYVTGEYLYAVELCAALLTLPSTALFVCITKRQLRLGWRQATLAGLLTCGMAGAFLMAGMGVGLLMNT